MSLGIEQRDHGTATWTNSFHTPGTTDLQLASPLASLTRRLNQQQLGSGRIIDYVIIGGGTSGLVVANRLTEDPDSR